MKPTARELAMATSQTIRYQETELEMLEEVIKKIQASPDHPDKIRIFAEAVAYRHNLTQEIGKVKMRASTWIWAMNQEEGR